MEDKKILGANEKYNYDLAVKYLDIVLLAPRTVRLLKDDANFDQIINRTINIVSYYEDNYETPSENRAKFVQAYRTLTGKDVTPETGFNFHDASDVLDTINYITVFVKNMTGLTWEEVEQSLKPKEVEAEYVEDKAENEHGEANPEANGGNNSEPQPNEQNTSSGYNFNTAAGNYYGSYQDDVADSIIMQQAALLLNRRILSGKVYQYKEKPLAIPIIKYIMSAFFILMTILSVISFGVLTYLSHHTSLVGIEYTASAGSTTINAQIAPVPDWSTDFPYQFIFFLFVTIFADLIILRGAKNDNFKYRFPWGWILFYLVLILLITFIQSGTNQEMVFNYQKFMDFFYIAPTQYNSNSFVTSIPATQIPSLTKIYAGNQPYLEYVYAVRGLQFAIYAVIIACVILWIIATVFNPKKDVERLQNLVQQYADDIRYGRVSPEDFDNSGSGINGFFGMF